MVELDTTHHTQKEYTVSEMLVECLNTYSTDIVITKYPHPIDGLKKIHRRIIYCLGTQINKDAMTALIGDASKLHQGGDSSIYSAIIRLSQPFSVGEPLVHCFGNYGNYSKPSSAGHARYLELASSEFTRDIFFNNVHHKSIPMTYSKDFRRMEPLYFIPRVPMALYLNNITIGYGYKSVTPQLSFSNVCDMVMMYASEYGKLSSTGMLAQYMMPDYPSYQYLINYPELYEAYTHGDYEVPIQLGGIIELGPKTIKIKSLPFGVIPNTVFTNVIEKLQKDKNFWLHGILKDINDYGGGDDYCELVLEFKNHVDIWKYLDNIKRLFSIEDTVYPIYNFAYNNKITHLNPIQLLELWYDSRYKSITASIKSRQTELQLELLKLSAYLVVCEHTDKVVSIIRSAQNEDECIRILANEFTDLTRMQSRVLANAKLSTLTKNSKNKLLLDIEKVETELIEVSNRYKHIHETIYNDAQFLKKKYNTEHKTIPMVYTIGCIHIDNKGVIQYFDIDELMTLLQKFKNSEIVIYHNNVFYPHILSYIGNKLLPYNTQSRPKEYVATHLLKSPLKDPYIGLFIDDGFSITHLVKFLDMQYTMMPITEQFYGITLSGDIEKTSISQHSFRKSISKGARTNYIGVIPDTCQDAVVIYMNTTQKNEIRLSRVLYNENTFGRLANIPNNDTVIVDVIPYTSKDVFITLPKNCIEFIAYKHIHIQDVAMLMKKDTLVVLDLNKRNTGYKVNKHPQCAFVATLR
jgi:DNA gyrase/topoisomerase IV subunit A